MAKLPQSKKCPVSAAKVPAVQGGRIARNHSGNFKEFSTNFLSILYISDLPYN
jgi:hypothetical protein